MLSNKERKSEKKMAYIEHLTQERKTLEIKDINGVETTEDCLILTGKCAFTGEVYSVTVTVKEMNTWESGEYIQDAFARLPKGQREFLISGVSPEGWNKVFNNKKDS
jgi:hypothetical protein